MDNERGTTKSHCVENAFWKSLWACRNAHTRMMLRYRVYVDGRNVSEHHRHETRVGSYLSRQAFYRASLEAITRYINLAPLNARKTGLDDYTNLIIELTKSLRSNQPVSLCWAFLLLY